MYGRIWPMDKTLACLLFAVVLAMAALLLIIGFTEAPLNAAGVTHDEIAAMQAGGDGAARLEAIGGYAFSFNTLLLLFAILLCVLSVSPSRRTPAFFGLMALVYALNMLVWRQMYTGHQAFLDTGATGWLLGFPTATAWQVYGIWFSGVVLIAIYSAGFRNYVLSEDDERRFEDLLEEFKDSKE